MLEAGIWKQGEGSESSKLEFRISVFEFFISLSQIILISKF
jgi:hypothetical protein